MSKKVEVFVRIRPCHDQSLWRTEGNKVYRSDSRNETCFDGYTGVFAKEDNLAIYSTCIKKLVEKFLKNENSTVFAYGQTGSGKTYTILGEKGNGLINFCLGDILKVREVSVSYLEIYNEKVFDLFSGQELKIYTLGNTPLIASLSSTPVSTPETLGDFLEKCETNRRYGSTEFNKRSSRSHTIFQVKNGENTLNLIDLAGSEKASKNESRRKEGAFINKSLLALCNLVTNIQREKFLGYRDSKLTRILQASLDGKTNILALCMISPQADCVEESVSTLKFAGRLSDLEIKVTSQEKKEFMHEDLPFMHEDLPFMHKDILKIRIHKTDMKQGFYSEEFKKHYSMEVEPEETVEFKKEEPKVDFYNLEGNDKENLLLIERIASLEKMVIDMLKKHPSKRMKEIFILEKHMFNLKLKKLKSEGGGVKREG